MNILLSSNQLLVFCLLRYSYLYFNASGFNLMKRYAALKRKKSRIAPAFSSSSTWLKFYLALCESRAKQLAIHTLTSAWQLTPRWRASVSALPPSSGKVHVYLLRLLVGVGNELLKQMGRQLVPSSPSRSQIPAWLIGAHSDCSWWEPALLWQMRA